MTKKQMKEKAKQNRVWWDMPLVTIFHKSKKDYNRQKAKSDLRKGVY